MFAAVILVLLSGFPVAFCLGGVALIFAVGGIIGGSFDGSFLQLMPNRLFGIMSNQTLLAVPLFVFMGVTLERARIAENLLENLSALFGSLRGGLGISVTVVGMLLAASTGIVGATVVTMGLLSLPTMLRHGYSPQIASGRWGKSSRRRSFSCCSVTCCPRPIATRRLRRESSIRTRFRSAICSLAP